MDTRTYEYVGFKYKVTSITNNGVTTWILEPLPGQHPAAYKDKHLRAALECFLQEKKV